jgi:hypothetical protein
VTAPGTYAAFTGGAPTDYNAMLLAQGLAVAARERISLQLREWRTTLEAWKP